MLHWGHVNHYTDKDGYNAISSQVDWTSLARQPKATHNPVGAYFTTYLPADGRLAQRLFVPRCKLAYRLGFTDVGDLLPLPGGRGRLRRIFYSPEDYPVAESRQDPSSGATGL